MKVLHVCETALGGIGTHLNDLLLLQFDVLGQDNVALLGPREHMAQIPDIPAGRLYSYHRPSRWRGLPTFVFFFIKTVLSFRPDIVHAHSTFAGFLARLIAPFLRVPVVYCPHGWAMERNQPAYVRRLISFAEWSLSFLSARIVAVSENERQRGLAIGIAPEKIVTVHNGLRPQPPVFTPVTWEDKRLKVLYVGRLDRQKGIDVLLRAIKGLEDRLSVRIVGDVVVGSERVSFEDYAHVDPLGWASVEEVNAQLAACDVVAMPSRWEGLPIVALEAMRLGKPVIASRAGGIPEVVFDGETGLLFDVEDDQAMRRLLLSVDAESCRKMGALGEARFKERFLAAQTYRKIMDLYEEILASRGHDGCFC